MDFFSYQIAGEVIQYEVSAQILLAAIRCARNHRDFAKLERSEQNKILQRGWPLLFALRASIWPLDVAVLHETTRTLGIGKTATRSLARARATVLELRPDQVELTALETFALCRPGWYL